MSTPSGKLPHFVDLATDLESQATPAEPDQPVKSGNDSPSPCAPKPADERAAAWLRVLAKDDADNVLSAYAPKRARSPGSGAVPNSDTDSLASVPKTLKEAASDALPQDTSAQAWAGDAPFLSRQQPSGSSSDCARTPDRKPCPVDQSSTASEQSRGNRLVKPAAINSLQTREAAGNERNKQRSGEMYHRSVADREIERVEDILRELKRRELGGTRLPRGPNLPPPESVPVAPDTTARVLCRRENAFETSGLDSLEPTRLLPPSLQPRHTLPVILGIPIVCMGAALAVYSFVFPPSWQPTLKPQMASLPPSSAASISTTQGASSRGSQLESEPEWPPRTSYAHSDLVQAKILPERDTAQEAVITSQRPTNTKLDSIGEQIATLKARKAVRALQPEEITLLVQQGEKFITHGDVVTARVIFERAAKADDAAAALALAAAYDPIVLTKLGVLGIDTDVEKARIWYEKAQSLGATQAADRLNALASR